MPYYGERRPPESTKRMISDDPNETSPACGRPCSTFAAARRSWPASPRSIRSSWASSASAWAESPRRWPRRPSPLQQDLHDAGRRRHGADRLGIARGGKDVRERWLAKGATKEQFYESLKCVDPVTYGKNVQGRKILMLNASHDEVIPKACTIVAVAGLWRAGDRLVWTPGTTRRCDLSSMGWLASRSSFSPRNENAKAERDGTEETTASRAASPEKPAATSSKQIVPPRSSRPERRRPRMRDAKLTFPRRWFMKSSARWLAFWLILWLRDAAVCSVRAGPIGSVKSAQAKRPRPRPKTPATLGAVADDAKEKAARRAAAGAQAGRPGGSARSEGGDLVTAIGGDKVATLDQFADRLARMPIGEKVGFQRRTRRRKTLAPRSTRQARRQAGETGDRRATTAPPIVAAQAMVHCGRRPAEPAQRLRRRKSPRPAPLGIRLAPVDEAAPNCAGTTDPSWRRDHVRSCLVQLPSAGLAVDTVIFAIDGAKIETPDDAVRASQQGQGRPGREAIGLRTWRSRGTTDHRGSRQAERRRSDRGRSAPRRRPPRNAASFQRRADRQRSARKDFGAGTQSGRSAKTPGRARSDDPQIRARRRDRPGNARREEAGVAAAIRKTLREGKLLLSRQALGDDRSKPARLRVRALGLDCGRLSRARGTRG